MSRSAKEELEERRIMILIMGMLTGSQVYAHLGGTLEPAKIFDFAEEFIKEAEKRGFNKAVA
jgi:hypothetical protein